MSKNLVIKITLIIVLVIAGIFLLFAGAVSTIYIAGKMRMWIITRDMTGGTSLVYEVDTQGLTVEEKKGLSKRMIRVLRRRVDPTGLQDLVWRPLGDTRFEIRMPLTSKETRRRLQNYEKALSALLAKNINRAVIIRSLQKPEEARTEVFKDFAQADPNRLTILETLATFYDERRNLQNKRDEFDSKLKTAEDKMSSVGLDLDLIQLNRNDWAKLNEQQLQDSLREFTDVNDNLDLLTGYVKTYAEWAKVVNQLTDPDKNAEYKDAIRTIDQLNLTTDQLDICLEMPTKSPRRREQLEKLKTNFHDRVDEIDNVVAAFDEYRPFRGRLDDPKDLQRMLKGAGILEFRVLPTQRHPSVDMDQMAGYVERLKEKGPKYASDTQYVWCEIENINEWKVDNEDPSIVAQFGDKYYVLAGNKTNETMLRSPGERQWKLERANPTTDNMGRRAIGFSLDAKGGKLFANVTGQNVGRPLCILLDAIAISAPSISEMIRGQGVITGSFTQTQVEDMVNKLNAGSLPARLIEPPISIETIGQDDPR